jgi:hypothetical protein
MLEWWIPVRALTDLAKKNDSEAHSDPGEESFLCEQAPVRKGRP